MSAAKGLLGPGGGGSPKTFGRISAARLPSGMDGRMLDAVEDGMLDAKGFVLVVGGRVEGDEVKGGPDVVVVLVVEFETFEALVPSSATATLLASVTC